MKIKQFFIFMLVFFLSLILLGCPNPNMPSDEDEDPDPIITTTPDAPTGLTASDGDYVSFIRLNWNSSYGAEGYRIYWSNTSDGTYTEFDTTSSTTFDDYDGGGGPTFFFKVKAYNDFGDSDFSNYDSGWAIDYTNGSWIPPEVPTDITASTTYYNEYIYNSVSYKIYKGWMTRGNSYTIRTSGYYYPDDPDLQLYNSYGDVLSQSTSGTGGEVESITYSCLDTGYYYFMVTNSLGYGFNFDFSFIKN